MADEIRGVAVLDDRTGIQQRLFVVCCSEHYGPTRGPHNFIQSIPVHEQGMPRTRDPEWTYRIEGDVMHLFPSLHVTCPSWNEAAQLFSGPPETLFHNGYNWTIPFVRWTQSGMPESDEDFRGGRWTLCYERNAALLGS
jgi:hypothetical protein